MYSTENIKQFPSVLIHNDFEYDLCDINIKKLALADGLQFWLWNDKNFKNT
jgi:hypothetical protein